MSKYYPNKLFARWTCRQRAAATPLLGTGHFWQGEEHRADGKSHRLLTGSQLPLGAAHLPPTCSRGNEQLRQYDMYPAEDFVYNTPLLAQWRPLDSSHLLWTQRMLLKSRATLVAKCTFNCRRLLCNFAVPAITDTICMFLGQSS